MGQIACNCLTGKGRAFPAPSKGCLRKPFSKRPFTAPLISGFPLGPKGCTHSLSDRDSHTETHFHGRKVRVSPERFMRFTRGTE